VCECVHVHVCVYVCVCACARMCTCDARKYTSYEIVYSYTQTASLEYYAIANTCNKKHFMKCFFIEVQISFAVTCLTLS